MTCCRAGLSVPCRDAVGEYALDTAVVESDILVFAKVDLRK